MNGICALCQKHTQLQRSHLIPQWSYKRVCQANPTPVAAPVHISNGNAAYSNRQNTRHTLCAECERRFSIREDYVARLTEIENGQIKLFSQISRLETPQQVLAKLATEVDTEKLVYFAASIFWRGCVMTGGCKLGSYEKKFRQYLLGQAPFPHHAIISFGLIDGASNFESHGWVSEPTSTKAGPLWLHGFLMTGLVFRCFVGRAINQDLQIVSLAGPNIDKYISVLMPDQCPDFLAAIEVAGTATRRGKLAKV